MTIVNCNKKGEKYKRSSLEKKFEAQWERLFPELELHVELTLVPGRRWRSDYTHIPTKTTIEINGGMYMRKSGHKGKGALEDFNKQNILTTKGYSQFVLGTGQITTPNIRMIGKYIHRMMEAQSF